MKLLYFLSAFWVIFYVNCSAQSGADKIHAFLYDSSLIARKQVQNIEEVRKFYALVNYEPQWTAKSNIEQRVFLYVLLHNTAKWGLYNPGYYPEIYDEDGNITKLPDDLIAEDIKLTEAAIHFYNDLKYGNTIPAIGFKGIDFAPPSGDIALHLTKALAEKSLDGLAEKINPSLPEINPVLNKIRWLQHVFCDSSFSEVVVTSKGINCENLPLITKLYQLGFINSLEESITDSLMNKAIIRAGETFQVAVKPGEGLNQRMITQLNVPLYNRLEQLFLSLNYYRWLSALQSNQPVVVVNIPAALLKVYYRNEIILEMRMIVGKPSTPTPTLLSRIGEVTLYPYWIVPSRIATNELLPQIKRNPGFIQTGNFQVLNKAGKIIKQDSVQWHLYSKTNFPFILRQSTGCDNALGILKLGFDNPYGVYLHDTPDKNLFNRSARYFSHGCMRMEKPFELARLILKNNRQALDTLDKTCLNNHLPVRIPAEEKLAVLVWYNPAGVDSSGRVQFYEDVYKRFPASDTKLINYKKLVD